MKSILVATALVLMTAGTAMAHGGVSFQIGVGIPLYYPYTYSTYYDSAPYGYYYGAPSYGYYYPAPRIVYRSSPYYGRTYYHGWYGQRHQMNWGGRSHYGNYGYGHGHGWGHGR